jgi:hypothetical protein
LITAVSGDLATLLCALGQEARALEVLANAVAVATAADALQDAGRIAAIPANTYQEARRWDQAVDWYSRAVALSNAAGDHISTQPATGNRQCSLDHYSPRGRQSTRCA